MLGLMKRALVGGALTIGLTIGAQAAEVRLLSFGGATNLPIWMALEKGFMEKEGVKLTFSTTNGSVEQIRDFYAGKYDVISTAFDNIVAYAEGQSDIPLPGPFDMFAFMGGHGGMKMMRMEHGGMGGMEARMFTMADANKDGKVTEAEATAAALARFDRVDTNKDGTISDAERQAAREKMRAAWKAKKRN